MPNQKNRASPNNLVMLFKFLEKEKQFISKADTWKEITKDQNGN